MRRSDSFNKDFVKNMQDQTFAKAYILSLMDNDEEPMALEDALRFTILQVGNTVFANMVGARPQTIDKFMSKERIPKPETLNKWLKPFGLKTVLNVTDIVA